MDNLLGGSGSGKVVGVIIPPPEIRLVVDKTAQFVSRNGKSFEQRILASGEGKTAKFNFMKPFDPYHAYYEMKIREFEEKDLAGSVEEKSQSQPMQVDATQSRVESIPVPLPTPIPSVLNPIKSSVKAKASTVNPIAMAILQLGKAEDLSPPPPLEFSLGHPTGINAIDIDVIKLTAQYTAVNGREFLGGLAQREQKNPQFDFLKPTHVLFSYFTSLVDSYAKILQPSNDLIARLQQQCIKKQVLQQALQRWQFTRSQEDRKKKESAEADEERLAFQAVDWQDFTVVETVDFPEDELFDVDLSRLTIPPLQHQLQIQQQLQLQQQQQQLQLQQQMELAARRSSIEANLPPPPPPSFKGPSASNLMPPPPPGTVLAPRAESSSFSSSSSFEMHPDEVAELQDQDIKVVANYQPRISGSSSMQSSTAMMMVDPLSGKAIPVGQMEEHMRVQLLDPKWREEQKRFADKQRETGFAEGGSIADSLRMFAKKRGDIFGQAAGGSAPHSAAAIAEEAARERKKQEEASFAQWDGHQGSIPLVVKMKADQALLSSSSSSSIPTSSTAGPKAVTFPAPIPTPLSALPPPPLLHPAYQPQASYPPQPMLMAPALAMAPPLAIAPVIGSALGSALPLAPSLMAMGLMGRPFLMGPAATPEKKTREFLSAEEFAAGHPGPVRLAVIISANEPTWNLQANQVVHLEVPVTMSVKELKELLSTHHVNGMPPGKQQLKIQELGFLKDTSTLAALNIGDGTNIELSAKSRGGKK